MTEHLRGLRVLVVEDESMISMMIEDTLEEMGCALAGSASKLETALELAGTLDLDLALLDLNLNGVHTHPVAEILAGRGIPYIFATGYGAGAVPDRFADAPALSKPFQPADLKQAIVKALDRA